MPITRQHPKLIICEGETDKAFFSRLMNAYGTQGIQVHVAGGNTQFAAALRAARTALFKSVLLVSDCDDNPRIAFQDVCDQIRNAHYAVPGQPLQTMPPNGTTPSLTVLMVPWEDEEGTIETVSLPAVETLFPAEALCLDTYAVCTHTDRWTTKARSQMRVECLIASTYKAEPKLSFRFWLERSGVPIDLRHLCFARVTNVVGHFVAQVI